MTRLIELIESQDERVAALAADKVLERAWGRPKEQPNDRPIDRMTPAERKAYLVELLTFAASIVVPPGAVIDGEVVGGDGDAPK